MLIMKERSIVVRSSRLPWHTALSEIRCDHHVLIDTAQTYQCSLQSLVCSHVDKVQKQYNDDRNLGIMATLHNN
jgi:hypothetical protein